MASDTPKMDYEKEYSKAQNEIADLRNQLEEVNALTKCFFFKLGEHFSIVASNMGNVYI